MTDELPSIPTDHATLEDEIATMRKQNELRALRLMAHALDTELARHPSQGFNIDRAQTSLQTLHDS